jgi:hypothetical protein
VVGKSRFVRPADGQPQTTPSIVLNPEKQKEKAYIFVPLNNLISKVNRYD